MNRETCLEYLGLLYLAAALALVCYVAGGCHVHFEWHRHYPNGVTEVESRSVDIGKTVLDLIGPPADQEPDIVITLPEEKQ